MPAQLKKLNDKQIAVLRWIAEGCPPRDWPDTTHKSSALALSSRGMVVVTRRSKKRPWSAALTERGRYYLDHGTLPAPASAAQRGIGWQSDSAAPPLDATSRAMRRVASRKQTTVKQTTREIRETYMRYKVVVTRVQVAERFVRAADEEDAAKKVQAEFDRSYGYFGSWKTTTSEVDVVEAEQTTVIHPAPLSSDGPLLFSIKDAAKALGISYSVVYTMVSNGEIEWVLIGSRKYISREHLLQFIKENTHKGYYAAR